MHGKCTYIIFVSTWSTPSPKMKMKPWSLCVWNQSLSIVRTNFQADKRFYTNPPDKGKPGWPLRALLTSLRAGATLSALKWVDWSSEAAMEEKQKNTIGDLPKTSHGVTDVGSTWKNPSCKFTQKHETFAHNVPCLLREQVVMSLARTHLHPKLVWRCDVGRHLSSWWLSGTNCHVERDCSLNIMWRKLVIGVVLSHE